MLEIRTIAPNSGVFVLPHVMAPAARMRSIDRGGAERRSYREVKQYRRSRRWYG